MGCSYRLLRRYFFQMGFLALGRIGWRISELNFFEKLWYSVDRCGLYTDVRNIREWE